MATKQATERSGEGNGKQLAIKDPTTGGREACLCARGDDPLRAGGDAHVEHALRAQPAASGQQQAAIRSQCGTGQSINGKGKKGSEQAYRVVLSQCGRDEEAHTAAVHHRDLTNANVEMWK